MLWIGLFILSTKSMWFCKEIENQYQNIYDKLNEINHSSLNELKTLVSDYWEENHHYCFQEE